VCDSRQPLNGADSDEVDEDERLWALWTDDQNERDIRAIEERIHPL
jgi:hypothetical protein